MCIREIWSSHEKCMVQAGLVSLVSNFVRFLQAHEKDVQVINLDALTYAGSLLNSGRYP